MRPFLLFGLASAVASQVFEAPDFNVTEALIEHGVDVSALHRLSSLTTRSSNEACDIAYSLLETLYGNRSIEFKNEPGYSAFTSGFWSGISAEVRPYCVTVVAGRIGDLGVGGLTLGGGISFITNEHGLVCDNVASFDVTSPKTFPDLYWSLRHGDNNFGIVTSFNLLTKPLKNDQIWGGTRTFTEDVFPDVVKAWIDLTLDSAQDSKAGSWIAWMNAGAKLASTELCYGAPAGNGSVILAPFYNITAVSNSTETRGHASYVVDNEASNTYGQCEIFYEITVKTPTHNGGNALGFDANGSPIHIIQLACSWNNAADDDNVYKVMSDIMEAIKSDAVKLGVQNDWVYMNYAAMFQDVIASYGSDGKKKLKTVAKKYDPTGVFQKLQPGYFKLDRAAVPDARHFSY
ncbi:hypothetical protein G6011_03911 [Alternaria panax]|uniref:FAD-binding PCMH-type domain-containing protein n=1 Tax=Alternaria panax TaxID=48097 RepID=A0AAD4IGC5_9PLEO|nr:hypothetical protein G6011_03911 [Alternaria panax]